MILTDAHIDLQFENFIPSVSLLDKSSRKVYDFPDPNSYYILSEAGKNYQIVENTTLILSLNRGYFESIFTIDGDKNQALSLSNSLFGSTKPIHGDAKNALELAILKCGKTSPSLKKRY